MDSLTKDEYLTNLKHDLSRLNFIKQENFRSIQEELKTFDVIGFDVDFTLVSYNRNNMIQLMYESIAKYLINHKNYPKEINYDHHKDMINTFSEKGYVIDMQLGNCLKLQNNKSIIKCYHGINELTTDEISSKYEKSEFTSFTKN